MNLAIDVDGIIGHLKEVGHTELGENKDIRAADVRTILHNAA